MWWATSNFLELSVVFFHFAVVYRKPTSFKDVLTTLQDMHGVKMAACDEDWSTFPRTNILIRREKLLPDALREVRKKRFDPTKLLNVCMLVGFYQTQF